MSTHTRHSVRKKRHARIRARVRGTASRPRLSVFRSNKFLYVQLIDDDAAHTIASVDTRGRTEAGQVAQAAALGKLIAEKAAAVGVKKVVFDRSGYRYQGAIAALANEARQHGLTF